MLRDYLYEEFVSVRCDRVRDFSRARYLLRELYCHLRENPDEELLGGDPADSIARGAPWTSSRA